MPATAPVQLTDTMTGVLQKAVNMFFQLKCHYYSDYRRHL